MHNLPNTLKGVPVFIQSDIKQENAVKRTWRERLFTLPFKPLVKTKIIKEYINYYKDGQIITTEEGLVMNQQTFNDCEAVLLLESFETNGIKT